MKKIIFVLACLFLSSINFLGAQILRVLPFSYSRFHKPLSHTSIDEISNFGALAGKNSFSGLGFEKLINQRYSLILELSTNYSFNTHSRNATGKYKLEYRNSGNGSVDEQILLIGVNYWVRAYSLFYESRFYATERDNGSVYLASRLGLVYSKANYVYKKIDFNLDPALHTFEPTAPNPLSGSEVRWLVPLAFKMGFIVGTGGRVSMELWVSAGYNFLHDARAKKSGIRTLYDDGRPYAPLFLEFGAAIPINLAFKRDILN